MKASPCTVDQHHNHKLPSASDTSLLRHRIWSVGSRWSTRRTNQCEQRSVTSGCEVSCWHGGITKDPGLSRPSRMKAADGFVNTIDTLRRCSINFNCCRPRFMPPFGRRTQPSTKHWHMKQDVPMQKKDSNTFGSAFVQFSQNIEIDDSFPPWTCRLNFKLTLNNLKQVRRSNGLLYKTSVSSDRMISAWLGQAELPTLLEVERHCGQQKAHRASGPDGIPGEICKYGSAALGPALHNLALKALLSHSEPHIYKGGTLCTIFKGKGSIQDPKGHRGILLSNSYSKVLHAWARKKLLPTYQGRAGEGQFGGLPSQQTATASHTLRLFEKAGQQAHRTTAVLFVDIRSAFHHMLREWIFSVNNPLTRNRLAEIFDSKEFDIDSLWRSLDAACKEPTDDIGPLLKAFLHDVHQDTWFRLQSCDNSAPYTRTERGSRPGSPIADIGFNLLVSRLLSQLQDRLQRLPGYVEGQEQLNFRCPPIAWVDDLAIPLTSCKAEEMPTILRGCIAAVQETFHEAGLSVNFDRTKTEAMISFRGPGSNAMKLSTFTATEQPKLVVATQAHVVSVCITPSYKHLGIRFACDADLHQEISQRLGQARSAYNELRKPIFANKHLDIKARLTLFDSLIASRLFFGAATWSHVAKGQLQKLEGQLVMYYRRIIDCGFWKQDTNMTDGELRAKYNLPTFRVIWARIRLGYLRQMICHAPEFYKTAILQEFEHGQSWLHELHTDLTWLSNLVELPFSLPPVDGVDWKEVWSGIALCSRWKALVRRGFHRHLHQEAIAFETVKLHHEIFLTLEEAGLQKVSPPDTYNTEDMYVCEECSQEFMTKKLLALHMYHAHKQYSDESVYVQGTVCPGCLKQFWTSLRLIQHLKYRPNRCYARTHGSRLPDEPISIKMPTHLEGLKRIPCHREHHGPLRPTPHQRMRTALWTQLHSLQQQFRELGGGVDLSQFGDDVAELDRAFMTRWREAWREEQCDDALLQGRILGILQDCTDHHDVALAWLAALCRSLHSVAPCDEALKLQSRCIFTDLGIPCLVVEIQRLQDELALMPFDETEDYEKSGEHARQERSRIYPIPSNFEDGSKWEDEWRSRFAQIHPTPCRLLSPTRRIALHLYSGRRRRGDYQWWYKGFRPLTSDECIFISLDTAVSPKMDVNDPKIWSLVLDAARLGRVESLMLGPPCETWSAARFNRPQHGRGPRPLRNSQRPWGMKFRSVRELLQIGTGSCLLLRGLLVMIIVALHGGATILEHPAEPKGPEGPELPSIWKTAVIEMLLRFFPQFQLYTIQQWRYGARCIKPTTFLYANTAVDQHLPLWELQDAMKPSLALIGKQEDGSYRTAIAKEYPSRLNAGLAQCATRFPHVFGCETATPWSELACELAKLSASLEGGQMQPDYQPNGR